MDYSPWIITGLLTAVFLQYSLPLTEMYFRQTRCPGQVVESGVCSSEKNDVPQAKCAMLCVQDSSCQAFLVSQTDEKCSLCTAASNPACNNTRASVNLVEFQVNKCLKNGGVELEQGVCKCPPAFDGSHCQTRLTDCTDVDAAGYSDDGVYYIYPLHAPSPFRVKCQLKYAARTMLMERTSSALDFYRPWQDYKVGFGNLSSDFWLGLEQTRILTSSQFYCVSFQYTLANLTYFHTRYRGFIVSDEASHFSFSFEKLVPMKQEFMGDSLSDVKGKPFSTYDADHDDDDTVNCAERHHSGWWFGNCTLCNPTGVMTQPADSLGSGNPTEVYWSRDLGQLVPVKVLMWLYRC